MRKSLFKKIILLFVLSLTTFSCGSETTEESLTGGDAVEEQLVGNFYAYVYKGDTLEAYKTHKLVGGIDADTDWTQQCSVPVTDFNTTAADIVCLTEAQELDLYARGATIKVQMPAGLCEYVVEEPYFYFYLNAGVGPAGPLTYSTTEPTCQYDYSPDGPNCCTGDWAMSAGADPATQPARNGKYNGTPGLCLAGASLPDFAKDKYNRPLNKIYLDSFIGTTISRVAKAPLTELRGSNVTVANYFRPSQHTNISNYSPAGDLLGGTTAPIAFNSKAIAGVGYYPNPFYTYVCYDTNREVRARIRLMIREWNVRTELQQGGNPDTTGANGTDGYNDYADWLDFQTIGPTAYPGI